MDSPLTILAKALERFPKYIGTYLVGLFIVLISDSVVTTLAIACIFLGYILSPLWGLAIFFFGLYVHGLIADILNYRSYAPVMPPTPK